jgi:plasmid stabilization system protein ParE
MAGMSMKIRYTQGFANSLEQIISYWQKQLSISPQKTAQFTDHLRQKIDLLKTFPQMGTDVTDLYHFDKKTYRLLIGHRYAIFYRINDDMVIVGAIFGTSQMKIKF